MKCIYVRTNTVNGKQYVGQTNDFRQREADWRCVNINYAGRYINNARQKYGIDSFETKVLIECQTQEELNFWEVYYIRELSTKIPNGYNMTDGGEGLSGYKHSEETKKRLSEMKRGQGNVFFGKKRPDFAEKMKGEGNPFFGKTHTQETIRKIIEANKGKPAYNKGKTYDELFTPEKAKWLREHAINNAVKTVQMDLEGNIIKVWDSAKEASRELGIEYTGICKCRKGEFKTYHNFIWKPYTD